jgi:hypothetical protein
MTANELADAIEKGGKDGFFQDEIVAILRQQQAKIESLEKAFEGERKYARYLSKICIDNKIPIVWSF